MNYRQALIESGIDPATADIFVAYHRHHPEIWRKFEEKANTLKAAGVKRYGAKAIAEVIRYEETIQRKQGEFKLNNSFPAYYARVWALKYKDADFFETRETRGLTS